MGTRCTITFQYNDKPVARCYRHWDGDPDTMGQDLRAFFTAVKEGASDTRFSDPAYLAAKYIVWQAAVYAADKSKPLDFLSVGVCIDDPGDLSYKYFVECQCDPSTGFPTVTGATRSGDPVAVTVAAEPPAPAAD
jgi:hypothetical protein